MEARSRNRHAAPLRAQCLAFAAALIAVPLLGVLAGAPPRDGSAMYAALSSDAANAHRAGNDATTPAARASATPDHALLDANDVRRALPVPPQAVAGMEHTTL